MSDTQRGLELGDTGGLHVATIAHAGLLWEVFLVLVEDGRRPVSVRGHLRFERSGPDGIRQTAQTTVIIIEDSYEEAVAKARVMDDRQLEGLLRSALPDR